jgi:hypothetical protein
LFCPLTGLRGYLEGVLWGLNALGRLRALGTNNRGLERDGWKPHSPDG